MDWVAEILSYTDTQSLCDLYNVHFLFLLCLGKNRSTPFAGGASVSAEVSFCGSCYRLLFTEPLFGESPRVGKYLRDGFSGSFPGCHFKNEERTHQQQEKPHQQFLHQRDALPIAPRPYGPSDEIQGEDVRRVAGQEIT